MLDYVRGFGELTLKGLVAINAPTMVKGALNELFHRNNITVEKVVPLVTENKSLWSIIPPGYSDRLHQVTAHVGNLDWLTVEWFIDAVKVEHPALASLFLSWRKGRNWLGRQIEEVKREI